LIQLNDIGGTTLEKVKAEIRLQLETMNKQIPEYSRVSLKNLLFLHKDQTLNYSAKGSLIRGEIIKKYQVQIFSYIHNFSRT
jgi:hypothetical protein